MANHDLDWWGTWSSYWEDNEKPLWIGIPYPKPLTQESISYMTEDDKLFEEDYQEIYKEEV